VNSESATRLVEKEQTAERSSGRDRPEVEVSARARERLAGQRSETERIAEACFTHAAAVTATADDNIVTRFFERSPDPDPGPEPRVREEIGERSTPV